MTRIRIKVEFSWRACFVGVYMTPDRRRIWICDFYKDGERRWKEAGSRITYAAFVQPDAFEPIWKVYQEATGIDELASGGA